MDHFGEPMDLAVVVWRMANDESYLEHVEEIIAIGDQWDKKNARKLLAACESLEPWEISNMVREMQPSSYVIAELVILAKQLQKSNTAKASAKERHKKNHVNKQKVFDWCDENINRFNSMDDAALDIAESFVPQKFRAVREWMTEWKKLRSAGTPQSLPAHLTASQQTGFTQKT